MLNMNAIKQLINIEVYKLSPTEKNTLLNAIFHLMSDVEIDDFWKERISKKGKSLERYVFDGVVSFMKNKDYTVNELWNHEDDCEIFDYIHAI